MADKKIALFIDADNVAAKFGKKIIDALTARGEIFIRRIYGNWEKNTLHGWNECILNFSLRAVQQTDFCAGKNATDMSLTIDAMDVLYASKADIFALVSNDSDFTPLAIRLREGGMTVVGLGNGHAANAFRMACNEFIDLDELAADKIQLVELKAQPSEKISTPKVAAPVAKVASVVAKPKVVPISARQQQSERDKRIQQVHELLSEVAKLHGDAKGFAPLCRAGQTLRKKNFGFGIKQTGYSSFQAFVKAFPKRYELIYRSTGENFCFRCRPVQMSAEEKIQRMHEVLRETSTYKDLNDDGGFTDLCRAGEAVKKKNLDVKSLGCDTLSGFIVGFPKMYEVRKVGGKFYYRCRETSDSRICQLHDILREAAKLHAEADGFSVLNYAGEAIKNKQLGFGVKDFGYSTVRKFIEAFPDLYEVSQDAGQRFRYRPR